MRPPVSCQNASKELDMISDDAALLRMMVEAGTNLGRPREIGHFCWFQTRKAANGAKASLDSRGGFRTDVYKADDTWVLHAAHQATLSEDYLSDMRPSFTAFAEDHDGTYDGWDADADPEPVKRSLLGRLTRR
jgi:hypothetical protein